MGYQGKTTSGRRAGYGLDAIGQFEGTVAPSYFNAPETAEKDFTSMLPLRFGRVVRVIPPTDKERSRSKAYFEYDVLAEVNGEHEDAHRVLLHNCMAMSAFGGGADFTRWTPRLPETDVDDQQNYGTGSRVFVMHVDASSFGGVIIGGPQVADQPNNELDDDARGHRQISQFNGVRTEIDHLGALTITRRGATKGDGSRADDSRAGSVFRMLQSGSVRTEARKDLQSLADDHIVLEAGKEIVASAGGQITVKSGTAGIGMNTPAGLIKTTGLGVHLGADGATDAMVMGTRYRAAETVMNGTVQAAWTATAAAFGAESAAWLWLGPLAIMLDPTATMTALAATAGSLTGSAAVAATAAATAMATFEAAAPTYLSLKHRLGDGDVPVPGLEPAAETSFELESVIEQLLTSTVQTSRRGTRGQRQAT